MMAEGKDKDRFVAMKSYLREIAPLYLSNLLPRPLVPDPGHVYSVA